MIRHRRAVRDKNRETVGFHFSCGFKDASFSSSTFRTSENRERAFRGIPAIWRFRRRFIGTLTFPALSGLEIGKAAFELGV